MAQCVATDTSNFDHPGAAIDMSAMQPPRLFDRPQFALRAARARRLQTLRPGADFLLARVADDLDLRLAAVNRPFPVAIDLFTPEAQACDALARSGRRVFHAGPVWGDFGPTGSFVADPDRLPLADASLDLVVSLLALQWHEDWPGLFAQVRRALRADGLFLACFVGGRTLHELRAAFAEAEAEIEGGASPRVIPFADLRDAGALLQRAGFALPVADVDTLTVRYRSLLDLAADLRAMAATNMLRERSRKPLRRTTLFRAAELYAERFADSDGRIRATFELVWMSGWAPHESQQKPLAPGSAKRSLAEALGVPEGEIVKAGKTGRDA